MVDRFRYQVPYFAVRGKIIRVKRATQRLSSVEECWQVKLLEPLTVGQFGINYCTLIRIFALIILITSTITELMIVIIIAVIIARKLELVGI